MTGARTGTWQFLLWTSLYVGGCNLNASECMCSGNALMSLCERVSVRFGRLRVCVCARERVCVRARASFSLYVSVSVRVRLSERNCRLVAAQSVPVPSMTRLNFRQPHHSRQHVLRCDGQNQWRLCRQRLRQPFSGPHWQLIAFCIVLGS